MKCYAISIYEYSTDSIIIKVYGDIIYSSIEKTAEAIIFDPVLYDIKTLEKNEHEREYKIMIEEYDAGINGWV